ncbi:hypothetical protein KY289_016241 [Solanum tuberosum]|nr:hypothetical protein KY289_016241 [Solanum tuberosum]
MDPNSQNSQLNQVLNNVLGLVEDASLLSQNAEHNEDSDGAYDGPESYLHDDDKDLINLLFEEMNQSEQEESISFGFGVVKKCSKKRGCEYVRYVSFACDRSRKSTATNSSKRVDCKCRLNCVVLANGSCRVRSVTSEHNHDLQPSLSRFFSCHGKISKALKRILEAHDIAGIRPAKSIRLLEVQEGGPDKMGCTPKDCRNYILQQQRMTTLACDAAVIQKFFASMQMKDDEFFYVIDTDDATRLRNVVWVQTHYKYAYREFSDVVCFDTTYLVNQWRMPFASFVGVNQHKQSILSGCALLTSADIETYKFVFSTWLAAMGNVPPTAILTDQCESIKAAITRVLPDTIHRYCIWHIMTKLPAKLKVFLKYYFWAGMMSTQRSESMHALFDGYIFGRSSLKQFVEQYELALRFNYEKELQAEFDSQKTHAAPTSGFDWDMQLQTHYTRSIYDAFVAEHMKRFYHCEIEKHPDFNAVEGVENQPISGLQLQELPKRDVIHPHIGKLFQEGYPSMTDEYKKYNSLKKWFDRNCDVVLDNNAKYLDFKNVLKGSFNAYSDWNDEMAVPSIGDPDSDDDVTFIRDPREVRTRGRP